jgi:hypothetical protein
MKPASNDALARQHAGEPAPVRHRNRAIGTIRRAGRTSPRSSAKLPAWPIGRPRIYGLPGVSCIALDRLMGPIPECRQA